MHEGKLYESTGSPDYIPSAKSMIGISNLETGKFEKKVEIDRTKYFGEGIVFIKWEMLPTYLYHANRIYLRCQKL
jgi:glutamine cyclotransferase